MTKFPLPRRNGDLLKGTSDTFRLGVPFGSRPNMYHAKSLDTDEHLIIKSRPSTSEDTHRVTREVYAAATLPHDDPTLVLAKDYVMRAGVHYLIYPYVPGKDMHSSIWTDGAMSAKHAQVVVDNICDALTTVHAHGIIHRDVKSSNILLTRQHFLSGHYGRARLRDFDIIYHRDLAHLEARNARAGTPHATAPEVWQGQGTSVRSDVYSLGATLFELLTGRSVFTEKDHEIQRRQHIGTAPPNPGLVNPDIPGTISGLLLKMLEKDPGRRISCPQEVREEYGRALRRAS